MLGKDCLSRQERLTSNAGGVIDHLNSNYLQLGLFALAFGGLQVWWISTTLRKRDLARPMSEGEFRKTLERIWAKKT